MSDTFALGGVTPLSITSSPSSHATITVGAGTVYYSKQRTVTAATHDGSVTVGETVTFTDGPRWLISNLAGARVFISYSPDAQTDMATQAELDAATTDIAVTKEAPINIEYPEYGAVGATSGTATDCTKALEKAIAALPSNGGAIFIPRRYKVSSQLKFDGLRSVRLFGVAGLCSGPSAASQLQFTQSGSEAAISARSTSGFNISDLEIEYTNASFTGPLLDLSHSAEGGDSAGWDLARVHLVGSGTSSALGVNLDKAIDGSFRNVIFQNLTIGVKGLASAGPSHYANGISFYGGQFKGIVTMPIRNAGEAWLASNVVFENLAGGTAGAYDSESGVFAAGLKFDSCWFGDATEAVGTWILFRGVGLTVDGGSLGSGALGVSVPDTSSDALRIQGVRFTSITDAVRANFGAGTQHYVINPNGYVSVSGKKVSLNNGSTDAGAGFLSN